MNNPRKRRGKQSQRNTNASERTSRMDAEIKEKERKIRNLRKSLETSSFQKIWEKSKKALLLSLRTAGVYAKNISKEVGIHAKNVCQKGVIAGREGAVKGAAYIRSLSRKISNDAKLKFKLIIIRKKMRAVFRRMGRRIYQLNLQGEKNVMQDEKVQKLIEQIEEHEQKIEKIESKLLRLKGGE